MDTFSSSQSRRRLHRKLAVALKHDWQNQQTPRVVATGRGDFAERILRKAEENEIPIQTDAALAKALSVVEVNREIPAELFAAVARVLSFVYRVDERVNEGGK